MPTPSSLRDWVHANYKDIHIEQKGDYMQTKTIQHGDVTFIVDDLPQHIKDMVHLYDSMKGRTNTTDILNELTNAVGKYKGTNI